MNDEQNLVGLVVRGPAHAPCVQLVDGTVCVPTMVLYKKRTGKEIKDESDSDYKAFQKGYFGERVEFGLRDILRTIFDSRFSDTRNNFVRNYNMGLHARRDLERRVGRYVKI